MTASTTEALYGQFLDGVLTTADGGQHLLLDGEALRADAEMDTLSGLGMPLDPKGSQAPPAEKRDESLDGRRVIASVRKFLTYSVGMEAATPLDQVTEILPYPPQLLALEDAARVLLVDAGGGELVGFVVPSLHAIEDSVWEESAPKESCDPGAMLQRGPLVKIGAEEQGRQLPNIDLVTLVEV